MKKKFTIFFALVSLFATPAFSQVDDLTSKENTEIIMQKVTKYLSCRSLHPFIKQGSCELSPVGFFDEINNTSSFVGKIQQGNDTYEGRCCVILFETRYLPNLS